MEALLAFVQQDAHEKDGPADPPATERNAPDSSGSPVFTEVKFKTEPRRPDKPKASDSLNILKSMGSKHHAQSARAAAGGSRGVVGAAAAGQATAAAAKRSATQCEDCKMKHKNYGLAEEGYRKRWCGACAKENHPGAALKPMKAHTHGNHAQAAAGGSDGDHGQAAAGGSDGGARNDETARRAQGSGPAAAVAALAAAVAAAPGEAERLRVRRGRKRPAESEGSSGAVKTAVQKSCKHSATLSIEQERYTFIANIAVGHNIAYKFAFGDVSEWMSGAVTKAGQRKHPRWVTVRFADGEVLDVKLHVKNHGSAWRMENSAVSDASASGRVLKKVQRFDPKIEAAKPQFMSTNVVPPPKQPRQSKPRQSSSKVPKPQEEGADEASPPGWSTPVVGKLSDAPVFRPTEEEFRSPLEYLEKIRPLAERFGICQVVPPASWEAADIDDTSTMTFNAR
jgi:hypothetical protein